MLNKEKWKTCKNDEIEKRWITVLHVLNNMPLCPQLWEENEEVEMETSEKEEREILHQAIVCASFNVLSFNGFFPMLEISGRDDTIQMQEEVPSW